MAIINGTPGNDTLTGGNSNDVIDGLAGNDRLDGGAGSDTLQGGAGNDLVLGGAGNDSLTGGDSNDTLDGGDGNDKLDGGDGFNTLVGGKGNDVYSVDSAQDVVQENAGEGTDEIRALGNLDLAQHANVENLTFIAGGDHQAFGNALGNVIRGNSGRDFIGGGGGNDTLDGGDGDDQLIGDDGNDTLIAGGGDQNILSGGDGNDTLIGGAGADILDGGAGNDRMAGGANDDTYVVDSTKDVVIEGAKQGADAVQSSISYTLGANLETLVLLGVADLNGTGNTLGNALIGNAGRNRLDGGAGNDDLFGEGSDDTLLGGAGDDGLNGGAGNDQMLGGAGNDKMFWDQGDGSDLMDGGTGIDTAVVNGADVAEAFTIVADGTGVRLDRTNDTPFGIAIRATETLVVNAGAGNDTIRASGNLGGRIALVIDGGDGIDTIQGDTGNDDLRGGADNDALIGGAGNDTLNGGAGRDAAVGGLGNDTYVVTDFFDTIIEKANEGIDTVLSSVSNFDLDANVENLVLAGVGDIDGTGNELANVITGNSGSNIIFALGGNDTLLGGAGDDSLDGGTGNDRMIGGTGDDIYVVDSTKDVVIEAAKQGIDIVQSSISFNLGANFENLLLLGAANLNGIGNTLANFLIGNAGSNRLDGGAGNDTLNGELDNNVGSDDTLIGGAGDDGLNGGRGNDLMQGGTGNDLYVVDSAGDKAVELAGQGTDIIVSDALDIDLSKFANVENVNLIGGDNRNATGNALNNRLNGNDAQNVLIGGAGNDILDGKGDKDLLGGGLGNDTYVVADTLDTITEIAGEGIDTVQSSSNQFDLGANVENLTLVGAGNINGGGNELNNVITGNGGSNTLAGLGSNDTLLGGAGDDILDGGTGNDRMIGGTGGDVYVVDSTKDVVIEAAKQGIDTVQSSISFTLGANFETLVLLGNADLNGTGNALGNALQGNGGKNRLDGGAGDDLLFGLGDNDLLIGGAGNDGLNGGTGDDLMQGGTGDDLYEVNSLADKAVELAGQGTDTIVSQINIDLSRYANVENVNLKDGFGDLNATGNALNNRLNGNDALNVLIGAAGNDTLNGGAGADLVGGGLGNDTYVVTDTLDTIIEIAGEGIDTVLSSVDGLALAANVENLVLADVGDIDGTGNELANVITGNGGNNTLAGLGGNDTLNGGAGDDSLDGGSGNDRMTGGTGFDVYVVDSTKDVAIELAKQGIDTVQSSISHTLGANLEVLVLTGAANLNGTGNTLDNFLTGNAGSNRLDGGAGNDTLSGELDNTVGSDDTLIGGAGDDGLNGGRGNDLMQGGIGNDLYVVESLGDKVVELAGQGTDTIVGQITIDLSLYANVENVNLKDGFGNLNVTGNALNNVLNGNDGGNVLRGGAGNDTLDGKAGSDLLFGGLGNDIYVITDDFDQIFENANEGIDTVQSANNFTLDDNFENLTLTGDKSINAVGNALNNVIAGNGGDNILVGEAGNDTLNGGDGIDVLDGGAGDDKMAGGSGNDFYDVDSVKDVVTEAANQGIDRINSLVSITLGANLENLDLQGNADLNGTGNALDNVIDGNNGDNILTGGAGNDDLIDDLGDDILLGGTGDDRMFGGVGRDVYDGGQGADTFNLSGDGDEADLIRYTINSASELSKLGGDIILAFQHGEDKISLSDVLDQFNIDSDEAFSGGFLKIEVVGNDTKILFDRNGGGDGFITLATLIQTVNVTADDLITTQL
jgi:Ca2+-binding RTX toxin-like protein